MEFLLHGSPVSTKSNQYNLKARNKDNLSLTKYLSYYRSINFTVPGRSCWVFKNNQQTCFPPESFIDDKITHI